MIVRRACARRDAALGRGSALGGTLRLRRPAATPDEILWWDRNGYCLLAKRLHRALFALPHPKDGAGAAVLIDGRALATLLAGVEKIHGTPRTLDRRSANDYGMRAVHEAPHTDEIDELRAENARLASEREHYHRLYLTTLDSAASSSSGSRARRPSASPSPRRSSRWRCSASSSGDRRHRSRRRNPLPDHPRMRWPRSSTAFCGVATTTATRFFACARSGCSSMTRARRDCPRHDRNVSVQGCGGDHACTRRRRGALARLGDSMCRDQGGPCARRAFVGGR